MAPANAAGSFGGTVRPLTPFSTISAIPPILLVITGQFWPCAS
jgi:hypothetical protein